MIPKMDVSQANVFVPLMFRRREAPIISFVRLSARLRGIDRSTLRLDELLVDGKLFLALFFPSGARIGSREIVMRVGISRLEKDGVVERRRGAGTFVAGPKIHFNKLMSYTEHMSSRGLVARSRILSAKVIENEQEVAARLGLPATSQMVKIERLRLTGEDPFALEVCYLPAPEFSGLVTALFAKGSLFATLEHEYEIELAYADEEVDATAADPALAALLGLTAGAPVLRIRQVIYSNKGKATIYGVGFYRSERHTLFIRRFR